MAAPTATQQQHRTHTHAPHRSDTTPDAPFDTHRDIPLDALAQYLREVRAVAPLVEDEEARLLEQIQLDAPGARTRLVEVYQPSLIVLAQRYAAGSQTLTLLDYVQEGNLGLLEAIARHDGRGGAVPFRTWAYWWVRGAMRQTFWRFEGRRGLPEHQARAVANLASAQRELLAELGRKPTMDELADRLRISVRRALELLLLQQRHVVGLERIAAGEDGASLAESIPAPTVGAVGDQEGDLSARVHALVPRLPERERLVVTLRYGFADGVEHTLREVADRLGVSRTTVAELDRRARLRLRRVLEHDIAGAAA